MRWTWDKHKHKQQRVTRHMKVGVNEFIYGEYWKYEDCYRWEVCVNTGTPRAQMVTVLQTGSIKRPATAKQVKGAVYEAISEHIKERKRCLDAVMESIPAVAK